VCSNKMPAFFNLSDSEGKNNGSRKNSHSAKLCNSKNIVGRDLQRKLSKLNLPIVKAMLKDLPLRLSSHITFLILRASGQQVFSLSFILFLHVTMDILHTHYSS